MREIYRLRRDEFYVALLTAIVVVVIGVEEGIILAIVLSLVLHVRRHYETADFVVTRNADGPPEDGVASAGNEDAAGARRLSLRWRHLLRERDAPLRRGARARRGRRPARWFVLDAAAIDDIDFSGGKTLGELADQLRQRNVVLALCEVNDKVRAQLETFGITAKVGADHIYETIQDAVEAFHRAQ